MLISFWVKNRRSFLNALRWKGILFSKSPSNSIFNCLCYHTPHSFPQSFSWFQSTLPRGERLDVVSSWKWRLYFNPRSHEGSDADWIRSRRRNSYFNPRSHEGSDPRKRYWISYFAISIHAPTRGATCTKSLEACVWEFQSTLPRGERRYDGKLNDLSASISIHAPTRGATISDIKAFVQTCDFNPRSHEGSDCTRAVYEW